MKISDFVEAGLRCPSCDSSHIRGAYHDWHTMDAFICSDCGLRWREDAHEAEDILKMIQQRSRYGTLYERFIWVLSTADFPFAVLLNPKSSDEVGFKQFIEEGRNNSSTSSIKEGESK